MSRCPSRREFLRRGCAVVAGAFVGVGAAAPTPPPREIHRGGMIYRRLGATDIQVSLLGFGSHTDPKYKQAVKMGQELNPEGQARRDRQLSRAFDLGVNLVDTYENEGQWEPLRRLLGTKRDRALVSICRQFPMFVGENIDRAARLFGHVDLYRIYVGDGDADQKMLEDWDVLRRAKEAGKLRAIGISTHSERTMLSALKEFDGLDYIMFPYNFIHARADYSDFLPAAAEKGVGLIAIKPLAAGSIVKLDPRAPPGSRPENERTQLYQSRDRPLLPAVVAELTKALDRLPDESLCQAAMRFNYSRPFLTSVMPGMFQDHELEDNYAALARHRELGRKQTAALDAAKRLIDAHGVAWLPERYRWLDREWRG